MPADVIGTNVVAETPEGASASQFQRGPVFANLLLADEISSPTPKTQSRPTARSDAGSRSGNLSPAPLHRLAPPFFVLATQNPLEMEGTYPLPEALARPVLFQAARSSSRPPQEAGDDPRSYDQKARSSPCSADFRSRPKNRQSSTFPARPGRSRSPTSLRRLRSRPHPGHAPREPLASDKTRQLSSAYGSRAHAAEAGTDPVPPRSAHDSRPSLPRHPREDMRACAHPALRHRLILNFEGQAENIQPDDIIDDILKTVEVAAGCGGSGYSLTTLTQNALFELRLPEEARIGPFR